MIHYMPPKSSIWGHRLQRLRADDFRKRFKDFMAEAVQEYSTATCNLMLASPGSTVSDTDWMFLNQLLANGPTDAIPESTFRILSEAAFTTCLDLLVSYKGPIPKPPNFWVLGLSRRFEISSWKFDHESREKLTTCELTETYGSIQLLGTRLEFTSLDEYEWVKAIVKKVFGIALNDRHVRPKIAP